MPGGTFPLTRPLTMLATLPQVHILQGGAVPGGTFTLTREACRDTHMHTRRRGDPTHACTRRSMRGQRPHAGLVPALRTSDSVRMRSMTPGVQVAEDDVGEELGHLPTRAAPSWWTGRL